MGISRFTALKCYMKFEILVVRIFSLRQKGKSDTFRRQKPLRQIFVYSRIFSPILTYSGILKHNQIYSGIIQTYSRIFRTLCNPNIFTSLVHSKSWHIQALAYSEFWCIQNAVIFIQNPGIFRALSKIYDGAFSKIVNR